MIIAAIMIRIPNTLLIESDSASVSARNRMRPGNKKNRPEGKQKRYKKLT